MVIAFCFICIKASAIDIVSCDKYDEEYIYRMHLSGALIQRNEIDGHFPFNNYKHMESCTVGNQIIMDGLGFTLYKPDGDKSRFIAVYNGLDGSSILYGPFKK